MRNFSLLVLSLLCTLLLRQANAQTLNVTNYYPNTSTSGHWLEAIEIDANGNSYHLGNLQTGGGQVHLIKYNSQGVTLLDIQLVVNGVSSLSPLDVTLGNDNYIYVLLSGTVSGSATEILLKVNPNTKYYKEIARETGINGGPFINNRQYLLPYANGMYWMMVINNRMKLRHIDYNGNNLATPVTLNTSLGSSISEQPLEMELANGYLYLLGRRSITTGILTTQMVLTKLNSALNPLYNIVYAHTTSGVNDQHTDIWQMAVNSSGLQVYVTGGTRVSSSTTPFLNQDEKMITMSVNDNGSAFTVGWTNLYDRPTAPYSSATNYYRDGGYDIYISPAGEIIAAGSSMLVCSTAIATSINEYYMLRKFTSAGTLLGQSDQPMYSPAKPGAGALGTTLSAYHSAIRLRKDPTGNIYSIRNLILTGSSPNDSKIIIDKYTNTTGTNLSFSASFPFDNVLRNEYWQEYFVDNNCEFYVSGNSTQLNMAAGTAYHDWLYYDFKCGPPAGPCNIIAADFVIDWKDRLEVQVSPFETVGKGTTVTSYTMTMGDGTTYNYTPGTNPNIFQAHQYQMPGTYTICLTVNATNGSGSTCSQMICKQVVINCYDDDDNLASTRFSRYLDESFEIERHTDRSIYTSTGHLLVPATINTTTNDDDLYLSKMTADGQMIWGYRYGTTGKEQVMAVIETYDNNYLIAGVSLNGFANNIFLLKVNPNGAILSQRLYDNTFNVLDLVVAQLPDANHTLAVVTGQFEQLGVLLTDASLMPLSGGFNTYKCVTNKDMHVNDILISNGTSNWDGFVVTGSMNNFAPFSLFVAKFNTNGTVNFVKAFDAASTLPNQFRPDPLPENFLEHPESIEGTAIEQKSNGNYIIVGNMRQWLSWEALSPAVYASPFLSSATFEIDLTGNLVTGTPKEIRMNGHLFNTYDFEKSATGKYALAGTIIQNSTGYNNYRGFLTITDLQSNIYRSGHYDNYGPQQFLNNVTIHSSSDLLLNGIKNDRLQIHRTDNNGVNNCYTPLPGVTILPLQLLASSLTPESPTSGTHTNALAGIFGKCEVDFTDNCPSGGCDYPGPSNLSIDIEMECVDGLEILSFIEFSSSSSNFNIEVFWPDGEIETQTSGFSFSNYVSNGGYYHIPTGGTTTICYRITDRTTGCYVVQCTTFAIRVPERSVIDMSYCELSPGITLSLPTCDNVSSLTMTLPNSTVQNLPTSGINLYQFTEGTFVLRCYGPDGCLLKEVTYNVTKIPRIPGIDLVITSPERVPCGSTIDLDNFNWQVYEPSCGPINGGPSDFTHVWKDLSGNVISPIQMITTTTKFVFECTSMENCSRTTVTVTFEVDYPTYTIQLIIPCNGETNCMNIDVINDPAFSALCSGPFNTITLTLTRGGSVSTQTLSAANPWVNFCAGDQFTIEYESMNGCKCYVIGSVVCASVDLVTGPENGSHVISETGKGQKILAPAKIAPEKDAASPSLNIYPNPSKDGFTFSWKTEGNDADIVIYDQYGKSIHNHHWKKGEYFSLPTYTWQPGIYYATVTTDRGIIFTQKLVLLK